MSEDFSDHYRVFDTGNDLHATATFATFISLLERPLKTATGRGCVKTILPSLVLAQHYSDTIKRRLLLACSSNLNLTHTTDSKYLQRPLKA